MSTKQVFEDTPSSKLPSFHSFFDLTMVSSANLPLQIDDSSSSNSSIQVLNQEERVSFIYNVHREEWKRGEYDGDTFFLPSPSTSSSSISTDEEQEIYLNRNSAFERPVFTTSSALYPSSSHTLSSSLNPRFVTEWCLFFCHGQLAIWSVYCLSATTWFVCVQCCVVSVFLPNRPFLSVEPKLFFVYTFQHSYFGILTLDKPFWRKNPNDCSVIAAF